uniref:Uncharacterized protein n=1 Tax=Pipistrellus kuhlii TaxID=59472 RepID=A0A7J7ZJB2_PIPKU|nr:hypothetical protein mPipKuh1_009561 [Pipistrellus kuhlii]
MKEKSNAANSGTRVLCPSSQWTQRSSCVPSPKRTELPRRQQSGRRKLKATQGTEVPTWSHLKKLKAEVEATSLIMFLLMRASVSFQSSAKSCAASPRTLSKSTPATKETHLVAKNINMPIILISHFVVLHWHCCYYLFSSQSFALDIQVLKITCM